MGIWIRGGRWAYKQILDEMLRVSSYRVGFMSFTTIFVISDFIYVLIYLGASHCNDFGPIDRINDSKDMIFAKILIRDSIRRWVK